VTVTEPSSPDDTNPVPPIIDPVSQFGDPALVSFHAEAPAYKVPRYILAVIIALAVLAVIALIIYLAH
jgi:hypothetical protein